MRRIALLAPLVLLAACDGQPRPWVAMVNMSDPTGAVYGTPRASLPAVSPGAPALRVLVAGDYGEVSVQRAHVTDALVAAHGRMPFDLALFVGDNLYQCGPDVRLPGADACRFAADGNTVEPGFAAPADPIFRHAHDGPLSALGAPGRPPPVYLVLGNHDVATGGGCAEPRLAPAALERLRACLSVAHESPTWRMPGRHWVLDLGPARFIGIDSNLLGRDYGGFSFEDELAHVREASAPCGERPCFLVAHHPPATGGPARRAEGPLFHARVAAVEDAGGGRLAAWLGGHHHDLQHLRTARGRDVFVSGNTSTGRDLPLEAVTPPGTTLEFFSNRWGFATLEVGPGPRPWWAMRFEDTHGVPLHCCLARMGGPCEPVACAAAPVTAAR